MAVGDGLRERRLLPLPPVEVRPVVRERECVAHRPPTLHPMPTQNAPQHPIYPPSSTLYALFPPQSRGDNRPFRFGRSRPNSSIKYGRACWFRLRSYRSYCDRSSRSVNNGFEHPPTPLPTTPHQHTTAASTHTDPRQRPPTRSRRTPVVALARVRSMSEKWYPHRPRPDFSGFLPPTPNPTTRSCVSLTRA